MTNWASGKRELPPDHSIFAALVVLVHFHEKAVAQARGIVERNRSERDRSGSAVAEGVGLLREVLGRASRGHALGHFVRLLSSVGNQPPYSLGLSSSRTRQASIARIISGANEGPLARTVFLLTHSWIRGTKKKQFGRKEDH